LNKFFPSWIVPRLPPPSPILYISHLFAPMAPGDGRWFALVFSLILDFDFTAPYFFPAVLPRTFIHLSKRGFFECVLSLLSTFPSLPPFSSPHPCWTITTPPTPLLRSGVSPFLGTSAVPHSHSFPPLVPLLFFPIGNVFPPSPCPFPWKSEFQFPPGLAPPFFYWSVFMRSFYGATQGQEAFFFFNPIECSLRPGPPLILCIKVLCFSDAPLF